MTHLAPGQSLTLNVDPRPLWVATGLEVAPGERYSFAATGKWMDWFRVVDANGWKLWPLQLHNRVPGAAFFCLCACVGDDDRHAFAIGTNFEWTVPAAVAELADAQLQLFANDWPGCYGNNHALPPDRGGPLSVTITRIT